MTSCTTNFTLEELRHIMIALNCLNGSVNCEECSTARRKVSEAIELMEIVETEKNARNR